MQKNISFNFYHTDFVNPVHVLSLGFIADGENRYCENFKFQ